MSKKRRKRLSLVGKIVLLLLVTTPIIIGFLIYNKNNKNLDKKENNKTKTVNKETQKDEPKTYSLKLLGTGDGLVHGYIYKAAYSNGTYDFTKPVSLIKKYISENKYDLAYYNQETVFGGSSLGYSGYPLFNTPSEYGDAMIDAGFNIVSLATNHSLDKGVNGAINSAKYWESKNVLSNGMASSTEKRNDIKIEEKNNITYALLSYTTTTNGIPVPSSSSYVLNVYDKEQVKKDIESIRDKVDVLIVAMHWGVEYATEPVAEQKEIAKYLASLDVDIVLGNHPHVIEPYEKIDNTYVFYSHGNFISNQQDENKKVAMMSSFNITKTVGKEDSTIKIDDVKAELIYTYNDVIGGVNTNYLVVPFSYMHDDKYVKNYKSVHEKYANIIKKYDDSITVIDAG